MAHHEQVSKTHGLYQTKANTSQNVVKALNNHRLVISQPCSLSSQVVFQVPNDSFIGTIALNVQMPATGVNQYLVPQFLANAVKSIRVRLGGSSEEIYLPHREIFFWQMSQCLSYQKQVEYTNCVGGALVGASAAAQNFYLILNLLSFSGLAKRVNLCAYMMQSPIQIVIEWAPLADVVKGSAAASYSPNFTCNMIVSQMVPYADEGIIKLSANQSYTHHFRRPFLLAPIATTASTSQQTINITGIPAGLCSSVLCYAVKQTDLDNGSYQYARRLDNLALLLNGSILHNYVGAGTPTGFNAYDVLNLPNTGGVTQALINWNNALVNATATVPYYMMLMGAESFPENMSDKERVSNGISLASQTLQLRFNQESADIYQVFVVLFLEYKIDIYGNGSVQIAPVMN